MASSAPLDGVVFGKDAFLSDVEDFHPEAQAAYREALDITTLDPEKLSEEERQAWTAVKRRRLTEFTRHLMTAVREQLPKAEFARDIYAPVLYYPESEEWLAQSFSDAMTTYNWVYVVASPELEGVALVSSWMDKLLERAAQHPGGLEKAVFDLQAFDGQRQRWVSDRSTGSRMRKLVERGARHISYGPDDFVQDRPGGKYVREAMTWQPSEKRR